MLSRIWLETGQVLLLDDQAPDYVYFPESGIVSVMTRGAGGRLCHLGMYGNEGFGNVGCVMGAPTSPAGEIVQVGGFAYCIQDDELRKFIAAAPGVRSLLLRYCHVFMMQVAGAVLANAGTRIEQRLARWLLMFQDRIGGNHLAITHNTLADILNVRRAGVTDAVHMLEGRKLIRAQRGLIHILDRPRLETLTGGSYGRPEAEYRRLI